MSLSGSVIVLTVQELPVRQRVQAVTSLANEFNKYSSGFKFNKCSARTTDLNVKYIKSQEKTNSCIVSILGKTNQDKILYRIEHIATNTFYEKEIHEIVSFLREILSKKNLGLQFENLIGLKINKSRTECSDQIYELNLAGDEKFIVKFNHTGDNLENTTFSFKQEGEEYTLIKKFSELQKELKSINADIITYNNIEVLPEPKPMKKPIINIVPFVTTPSINNNNTSKSIDKEEEIETLWARLPQAEKEILRELHNMDIASFRKTYCNDSRPILTKIVNQVSNLDSQTRELVLTLTGCLSKGKNNNNNNYSDDSEEEDY